MSLRRWSSLAALAAGCLTWASPAAAQSAAPCTLPAIFQPLHDSAASDIGACRGAQLTEANGDVLQVTAKGLLMWRKDANWTGFIGASRTLVMTADGASQRLNTERFDWELDGLTADTGMFTDAISGLLPAGVMGPGFESVVAPDSSPMMASATMDRPAQDRFRGARSVVQTVQLQPTPDLAHSLFVDLGNLQQGDMSLKTSQLGDESAVVAWKPDDVSSFSATFRQLAIRARKSNAVVTVVLAPGTRLDTAVQLVSMIFGRLI